MSEITKTQYKKIAKQYAVSLLKHVNISSGLGTEIDVSIKEEVEGLAETLSKQWKLKEYQTSVRDCVRTVVKK